MVIVAIMALVALIAFQQSYAKSHNYGIEQPVGWFGIAEYYFRHPFGRWSNLISLTLVCQFAPVNWGHSPRGGSES